MKTRSLFIYLAIVLFSKPVNGQGRVVINEFMAWSGCANNSEFIELLNFGPGPVNIGCYIITNGTYSVTIPPNTILQPRQYYVLAGQNTLARNCGNIDSTVQVDLNWNSCGCLNDPIPAGGDGFLKNGGGANEKLVVFDNQMQVVDAVTRSLPVSASVPITTASVSNQCIQRNFDLDTMSISYETVGVSTGIDNSFARKVDGDCGWVKTTSISARAPNKTDNSSSASYQFTTVSAYDCQTTTGSIAIEVNAADVQSLFPMSYILGYDADSNGVFNDADVYVHGIDSAASSIGITDLLYGRYRLTVASSSSCNLKTFDFFVFNCYGVLLPVKLLYFNYKGEAGNQHDFGFEVSDRDKIKEIRLEGNRGSGYETIAVSAMPLLAGENVIKVPVSSYRNYRLRMEDMYHNVSYSREISVQNRQEAVLKVWPNPVKDLLHIDLKGIDAGQVEVEIFNSMGLQVKSIFLPIQNQMEPVVLPANDLKQGLYYIKVTGKDVSYSLSFIKI